jgi:hypothetical protein
MPASARSKSFAQRNLLAAADVAALFPEEPAPVTVPTDALLELPIVSLWLDDQPRQIVPDETLARLISADRAQPAHLLAELQAIASDRPHYAGVLRALRELAQTIASDGVLEPILVVRASANPSAADDGEEATPARYVVRDGHRRTLASLLANRETVPARLLTEDSDLQATARQLVLNVQRQDLTALEKGRWLLRLARLVETGLRVERGLEPTHSVLDALLVGAATTGDDPGEAPAARGASSAERELAAAIRTRVCELSGIGERHYYNLLYLNRLTPEAREAGLGLAEGQLRPVTSLPPSEQAEIVRFIASRKLTSRESQSLVQVAKSGDRDAVRRVMAKLAKEDAGRQRASVSWEGLMHALPRDIWVRCASLRAELGAVSEDTREVRLRTMWEQRRLAEELSRQFDDIFALYGYTGEQVAGAGDAGPGELPID